MYEPAAKGKESQAGERENKQGGVLPRIVRIQRGDFGDRGEENVKCPLARIGGRRDGVVHRGGENVTRYHPVDHNHMTDVPDMVEGILFDSRGRANGKPEHDKDYDSEHHSPRDARGATGTLAPPSQGQYGSGGKLRGPRAGAQCRPRGETTAGQQGLCAQSCDQGERDLKYCR